MIFCFISAEYESIKKEIKKDSAHPTPNVGEKSLMLLRNIE